MSAKSSAIASMDPMTCSTGTKEAMSSRFIIKPATGEARLVRNCLSRPLRLNEGPRFQLEINIDRVAVVVLDKQYDVAHKMVDHLRLYSKGLQYRKWRPIPENGNRYFYYSTCLCVCVYVCVYVCVCACVRVRVCVCVTFVYVSCNYL